MQTSFTILSAKKKSEDKTKQRKIAIPLWVKKYIPNLYWNICLKKRTLQREEIEYIGELGEKISLPFTLLELEELGEERRQNYINQLKDKLIEDNIYIEPELRKYIPWYDKRKEQVLTYCMLDVILQSILKKYKIERKELKLILIDCGKKKIEYILELFVYNLNYLTIITERPEYFTELKEKIYEEIGLVIEIVEYQIETKKENRFFEQDELMGNVVIDLSNNIGKICRIFPKKAIYLDPSFHAEKLNYIKNRRNDLSIIFQVFFSALGKEIDNSLFCTILYYKNPLLYDFVLNGTAFYSPDELLSLISPYKIEVKGIKIIKHSRFFTISES